MDSQAERIDENKRPNPSSFHARFNIPVDSETAKRNFVNRALNLVELNFPFLQTYYINRSKEESRFLKVIATELGIRYDTKQHFSDYTSNDFTQLLLSLEALYKVVKQLEQGEETVVDMVVREALVKSEVELGIRWRDGVFWRSGAKLLDEELINEPLHWLSDPTYRDVLIPFKKGVSDFLKTTNHPGKLKDVVRDMYEALEKMARVICGNNNNLGANTEQLINTLQLSPHYEDMLRKHTEYAHEFRHAVKGESKQKLPQTQEVEAFIYTTGLFIRLAIERLTAK